MMVGTDALTQPVRQAIEMATRAPSIHNSQPWLFVVGEQHVDLRADLDRWLPVTDADQRDLLLSCGAALHHLRLALAAAGLGGKVRRFPDESQADLVASIELNSEGDPIDPVLYGQITRRRSDRRPFRTYPVPDSFRQRLMDRAAEQGVLLRVVDDARARQVLVAAFATAAEVQTGQPGYAEELTAWTQDSGGAGIPATNLVRPVDSRVEAARDFGGQAETSSGAEPEQATLLVLGTASDDRLSQLRAGEAMSAVLLEATQEGLGTCPLSQPLEVGSTRDVLRDRVLGGTLCPQVVLRIGWAQTNQLPATPRRPLAEVVRHVEAGGRPK